MVNAYKRLGINTFWIFVGNIGPRLVSFLLLPLYTHWLSPADFGIQDIIIVYSTLLVPYITLGLYEAVFVFPKDRCKEEQSAYLSTSLVLFITSFFVFLIVFCLLGDKILRALLPNRLFEFRYLLIIIIFTQSLQRITQFFLRGIDRMKDFSMSGILYAVIMLLVGISLVPHYGINGYWISLISADIFSVIYIAFRIKLKDYLQINLISKNTVNEMLRYSVPLIPNATMWWIVNSINRPILVSSVGLDGVGLYAVAGKFPSILSVLFAIFFGSFQISAIEEYNKDSFNSFYNKIFKLQLFPQIFAVIIFELLGCVLFHIFVDEKYYAAERYLPLFCCGVLLSNVAMYVGVCFTVIKKTKYMLYSAIIAAVVAVVANYCLIPLYGIYGACISVLLSQFSMIAFRYIQSSKIETLHIDSSVILQISILSISLIVFYLVKPKLIANGLIVLLLFLLCFIQRRSIIHIFNFIKTKYIK